MEITVRMVVAMAVFFALMFAILGAVIWRRQRTYAGSGRQAIAKILSALCMLLFTLQPVLPDWIGVVGANAMAAAAAILVFEATREYRGLRPQVLAVRIGGILAVLAVVYFDYFAGNINARVVEMSAFTGLVVLLCSFTLLRKRGPGRTLAVLVSGVMFAMSAALLMTRAIYFLFAPPLTDLLKASWVNEASFVGSALMVACCFIAWKQMTEERVLVDLTEAENRTSRANREVAEVKELANSWKSEIEERKLAEEELRLIQAQLMSLAARLVQAQETERRQLARELHDNFGQVLATLRWEASGMQKSSSEVPAGMSRRGGDLAKKIGALADDIHRVSQRIHPLILDDLRLEVSLKAECMSFSRRFGIRVQFRAKDVPHSVPGDLAVCLFRVMQESLLNIEKHADAKEVRVLLTGSDGGLTLLIEDSGNGFIVEQARGKGGLGVFGMESRVRLVNGTFQIRSQPGEGTTVEVHLPLSESRY